MNISPSLYKRLISYAGLAAATLAASDKDAEAQIIYTDVIPDHSYSDWVTSPYQLDINNDGIIDFEFYNTGYEGSGPTWCGSSSAYVNALGSNAIMMDGKPVDNGFVIDSLQDWEPNGYIVELDCSWESNGGGFCDCHLTGNWNDEWSSKFLGIRLVADGESYYGWIRLRTWGLKVEDYALQSLPNESIVTGATDNCDTLQAEVSPPGPVHACVLGDEIILQASYPLTPYDVDVRWQKDYSDIPDADSKSLVINEPGNYRAIIDGYGCADTTLAVTAVYSSTNAPPTTLTQHFDTLISGLQSNYIWYKSYDLIDGATGQFIIVNQNAMYQCYYLDSLGCMSTVSNIYATTCANTQVTINDGSEGSICDLDSYTICTTGSPSNSTYHWFLDGALIPNAPYYCYTAFDPGVYQVVIEGYQSCTDTSSTFELTVHPQPLPVITLLNDSVIQSNYATGNQWDFNSVPISGATEQECQLTEYGIYKVMVTDSSGCTAISQPYYFNPVGITNTATKSDFLVFVDGNALNVVFSQIPIQSKLLVVDMYGNRLFKTVINNVSMAIDVAHFADGLYFVIVDDGEKIRVKKLFIGI